MLPGLFLGFEPHFDSCVFLAPGRVGDILSYRPEIFLHGFFQSCMQFLALHDKMFIYKCTIQQDALCITSLGEATFSSYPSLWISSLCLMNSCLSIFMSFLFIPAVAAKIVLLLFHGSISDSFSISFSVGMFRIDSVVVTLPEEPLIFQITFLV